MNKPKPRGRPKAEVGHRTFISVVQAANQMGYPLAALRVARKLGADGFGAGGHIYEAELLAWLSVNQSAIDEALKKGTGDDYSKKRTYEQWRKLKIENDVKEGRLVPLETILPDFQQWIAEAIQILRQELENNYPQAVAGLDVAQARVYGRRLVDQIITAQHKLLDKWITPPLANFPQPAGRL